MIRRLLILGALALASGAMARFVLVPAPAVATAAPGEAAAFAPPPVVTPVPPAGVRTGWSVVWTRPAPDLRAMDLAPDGQGVAWVDGKGAVRLVDALSGQTLWRTKPLSGVNAVAAVPSGVGRAAVLAYSRLNPAAPRVYLLPRAGAPDNAPAVVCAVDGAVWDVAVSLRGERALIGTGRRSLYVLPLRAAAATAAAPGGAAASPQRLPLSWQAPGIPGSLAITDEDPLALAATWQDAGVSAYGLDGTPRWRHDEADPARLYLVRLSSNGKTAVAVSARAPRESGVRLHVWDADSGDVLFAADLPSANHARVLVSADGTCIAVTYLRMTHYRTGDVTEHKLAAWDRTGQPLFKEKGGSGFFSPDDIVAVSHDGNRLTVQDRRRNILYTLDARGRFVHQMRLPAAGPKISGDPAQPVPVLRETVATPDGAFLLVHRGDGQISLLKAVSAPGSAGAAPKP